MIERVQYTSLRFHKVSNHKFIDKFNISCCDPFSMFYWRLNQQYFSRNIFYEAEPRIWKSVQYYVTAVYSMLAMRLTYHREIFHDLQWVILISNRHLKRK